MNGDRLSMIWCTHGLLSYVNDDEQMIKSRKYGQKTNTANKFSNIEAIFMKSYPRLKLKEIIINDQKEDHIKMYQACHPCHPI